MCCRILLLIGDWYALSDEFFSSKKRPSVLNLFGFGAKCPKCGSKDTKSIDYIIKK